MKTKETSLTIFTAKILALLLVLVLFCIMVVQSFHHHSVTHKHDLHGKTSLAKAEHCKVCDHFYYHKSQALIQKNTLPEFTIEIPQPIEGGVHFYGKYSRTVHSFTNKGPPTV